MQKYLERRFSVRFVLTFLSSFVLVAASAIFIAPTAEAGGQKVTICHIPPGNPANAHEITISVNAVPAHIANHGDTIGACGGGPGPGPGPGPGGDDDDDDDEGGDDDVPGGDDL